MKPFLLLVVFFSAFIAVVDCRAEGVAPSKAETAPEASGQVEPPPLPFVPSKTPSPNDQRLDKTSPNILAEPVKKKNEIATEAQKTSTPSPLDLPSLEKRLRETKAVGVFTKITLKNQVDDLVDQFRDYHRKERKNSLDQLRQRFDMLLLKLLTLLQDEDPALARTIVASREAIWSVLTDPVKFKTI
jgi:hypothetical protein